MIAQINEARISYTVHGEISPDVPLVLLFNGAFMNKSLWDLSAKELNQNSCACIAHDVRGVGDSEAAPPEVSGSEQFNFDQYASDAKQLLNFLKIKQKVFVCGMAWGSRVALVFAAKYPELTEKLVLLDVSIGVSTTPEWAMAQKMGVLLAKDKLRRLSIEEGKISAKQITQHKNQKVAALAMHATSKPPYDTADGFSNQSLNTLSVPVAIVMGEFDPNLVASPGGAYEIKQKLEKQGVTVSLQIIEATGHASIRWRPQTMAHAILHTMNQYSKL